LLNSVQLFEEWPSPLSENPTPFLF